MTRDALIKRLSAAAGRAPTNAEMGVLSSHLDYNRALRYDADALRRLCDRFCEMGPHNASTGRGLKVKRVTVGTTQERKRTADFAGRFAREAAGDPAVQLFRAVHPEPATIESLGTGVGYGGPWEMVRVKCGSMLNPAKLRLHRGPVALETDERPRAGLTPGSPLEAMLRLARALAMVYGWSEAEAVWLLLANKKPKPMPVTAQAIEPLPGVRLVTILAHGDASRASVAAAFVRLAKRARGRPPLASTGDLVSFVDRETAAHDGKRPRWTVLAEKWNKQRPRRKLTYRHLRTYVARAAQRALRARG